MRPKCHISVRIKGCCDTCGNWPNHLHMPEDLHGWYCGHCCPACKAQAAEPPGAEAPPPAAAASVDVPPEVVDVQAALAPQAA
jgi:hypothetical protein